MERVEQLYRNNYSTYNYMFYNVYCGVIGKQCFTPRWRCVSYMEFASLAPPLYFGAQPIPRSCKRSSTLRSDSGKRTYSITAKRMISGLVLKCLSGECFVIQRGYGTALHGSSSFYLTVPSCRTFADTDRCDRPLLRLPKFVQHVPSSVHCRHLAVSNVITGLQYAGLHRWPLGRRLCPRLSSRYQARRFRLCSSGALIASAAKPHLQQCGHIPCPSAR